MSDTIGTSAGWPRPGVTGLGLWITFLPPLGIEALTGLNLGWLGVDLQHGELEPADVPALMRAAESAGLPALVRLPSHDPTLLARALDAGADGVVVPGVESAQQAGMLVAAARHPPVGNRSTGVSRAAWTARLKRAPGPVEPLLLLMIESRRGAENVEEIAGVQGVDGLFVGPYDLALSLGHQGPVHPDVVHTIDAVVRAARSRQLLAAAYSGSPELTPLLPPLDLLAVDSDVGILRRGLATVLAESAGAGQVAAE